MATEEERKASRLKAILTEMKHLVEREIINTPNPLWALECFRSLNSREYCITRGYNASYTIVPSPFLISQLKEGIEETFQGKDNWHQGEYVIRKVQDKIRDCELSCKGVLTYLENKDKDEKKLLEETLKERITLEEDIRFRFRRY